MALTLAACGDGSGGKGTTGPGGLTPPKIDKMAAWDSAGVRAALCTSVQSGLGAAAIALVLGSLVAFAVHRHRFFGRQALSLLVVLPIALPGIVTGIALDSAWRSVIAPLGAVRRWPAGIPPRVSTRSWSRRSPPDLRYRRC